MPDRPLNRLGAAPPRALATEDGCQDRIVLRRRSRQKACITMANGPGARQVRAFSDCESESIARFIEGLIRTDLIDDIEELIAGMHAAFRIGALDIAADCVH